MDENLPKTENPVQVNKKLQLNKTALLVAGLTILTAILLLISFSSKTSSPLSSITKNEEADFAHTSLSISEDIRPSSPSGAYEVDVLIDSSDNKITGGQLEISFDPKILKNVDIKPGSFLSNPSTGNKKVDQANGKITYTLLNRPGENGVSGNGVLATITFSKTGNEETFLEFLPQTLITAENPIDQSVLKETTSGVIGKLPAQ